MEEFPSSGMKPTGTSNPLGQSYSQIASPRNEFPSHPNQGHSASTSVHLSSAIDGSGSSGDNKARPFRYSREALLALFDEEKVRERPLELMEWAMHPNNSSGHAGGEEGGIASIILSDKAGIPMGLVDWTSEEKKVSSVCAPSSELTLTRVLLISSLRIPFDDNLLILTEWIHLCQLLFLPAETAILLVLAKLDLLEAVVSVEAKAAHSVEAPAAVATHLAVRLRHPTTWPQVPKIVERRVLAKGYLGRRAVGS